MDKAAESGVAAMAACYQGFDPSAYLQYNYTPPRADFQRKDSIVPWKLACLHRAFTEGEEEGAPSLYVAYIEILVCFFFIRRCWRRAAGGRGLGADPLPGAERLRGLRQGATHRLPGGQQAGAEALAAGWQRLEPGLDALPAARLPVRGTTVRPGSVWTPSTLTEQLDARCLFHVVCITDFNHLQSIYFRSEFRRNLAHFSTTISIKTQILRCITDFTKAVAQHDLV